ncbi:MAG: SDR family NAD(P)-dependent oxidoreductase, partial [Verrucomicrobia bacterium]|nr:SDR family NAD(P)-dependent oxidoreductase [Verrucomicrobiota bacterium]
MDLNLKDKKVFITGAGSGIGRAMAVCFAQEGAVVYILDLNEEGGRETEAAIRQSGGNASFHSLNVADTAAVQALFTECGPADVLVNNAGIASIGNVEATSPEEMDKIYAVNIKGVYN